MKNRAELDFLLQIVRGESAVRSENINYDIVIKLAIRHKLLHTLYTYSQKNPDFFNLKQVEFIEERVQKIALKSLDQLSALKELVQELNAHEIGYVLVKGPQLSRMLYSREAIKESVDLDVMLTRGKDIPQAILVLKQLGYNRSAMDWFHGQLRRRLFLSAKREMMVKNDSTGITVDLHFKPVSGAFITAGRFEHFFDGIKSIQLEDTPIYTLQDEQYFIYLCYHGALHQFSRLAWLMDIRAFIQLKKNELDFKKVFEIASSMHIERCVWLALILIRDYFGEQFDVGRTYPENRRLKRLTGMCRKLLYQPGKYVLSLKGRFVKLIYAILLIKGIAGKIDWLVGIFLRQILKMLAKKAS